MRTKRTKTSAFDWAAIRWARLREENERVDEPAIEPKKNERGRIVDPIGYLSARAKKILDDSGVSAARLRERVLAVWFFSLIFVATLGAIVFPFARADHLLGGGVNLAGPFVFFLLGQIFFLATSALFVGIALVQSFLRIFRKNDETRTFAEKTVERLCGLTGWFALVGLRQGIRVFYAFFGKCAFTRSRRNFFGKKTKEEDNRNAPKIDGSSANETKSATNPKAEEISNGKNIALLFWDSIFLKPRFLFFWGGVLSHLFWASCSICVLLILATRMQGNRYDYCWHTSLEDERIVKKCVDFLGAPIATLGGTVPSEEDVRRLFVSDRSLQDALGTNFQTDKRGAAPFVVVLEKDQTSGEIGISPTLNFHQMEAKTRSRWSRFLLSVVFIWCVAPRCLLIGAYYYLLRRSLRDFRPNLNDPYFKRLIDRAEAYSTTTRAATVVDSLDDTTGKEPEPQRLEKCPLAQAAAPTSVKPETPANVENVSHFDIQPTEPPPTEPSIPVFSEEKRDKTEKIADKDVEEAKYDENTPLASIKNIAQNEESEKAEKETRNAENAKNEKETPNVENTNAATSDAPKFILTLGYDAEFSAERWTELFDAKERRPVVFADVAAEIDAKRRFRTWTQKNGSTVDVCAVATDVSLSPAKHCVKFLRQDLGGALPNARIFVVLSGGEKLRRKFGTTATNAVAERVADWRDVLAELTRTTDVSFEPIFFFDAELDLPEPRERLRRLLTNAARGARVDVESDEFETTASNRFAKWDAAAARIDAQCRQIFNDDEEEEKKKTDEKPSEARREERDRRRIAVLLSDIFAVYREETNAIAESATKSVGEKSGAALLQRFSKISEAAAAVGDTVGDTLEATLAEKGFDAATLEKNLTRAVGLSAKMQTFCKKLSPRCALAAGALGVSAPVVAAFAPLFGGALTASAIASTFGAFGTLLPTAFASGATSAALGAVAPLSLSACKKKLVEKWRVLRSDVPSDASPTLNDKEKPNETVSQHNDETQKNELLSTGETQVFSDETLESVAATVCAAATWAVALELQGWSEEKIVAALPVATRPLETSPLDSPKNTRRALDEIRDEIRKMREIERSRG